MIASHIKDPTFSLFTFYLLKDSGWYGVNLEFAESLEAGKGMGCEWYNKCHHPKNQNYFCENLN